MSTVDVRALVVTAAVVVAVAGTTPPPARGSSTVVFDLSTSAPGGHASVQVIGLRHGIFGLSDVLNDVALPSRQERRFTRDRGSGSLGATVRVMGEPVELDDCVITVDGRVVRHERATSRCTYSENPEWQYLLEKGVP